MKKLLIIVGLFGLSLTAFAQAEKPTTDKPIEPEISAFQTAYGLVKYGYANQSASALVEAAKIIANTPEQEADFTAQNESTAPMADKDNNISFELEQLIADAKNFAGKDKTLLKYINEIEKEITSVTRGSVVGPRTQVSRVNANSTDIYEIQFWANEWAEVYVCGDGDTDLDLYVYDANGNLIGSDTDYTDECLVRWVPVWTGTFYIHVKNRGSVYNKYIIAVN